MNAGRRTIGRYEVLRRLRAGGMGTLYLARDPDLDRLLAIKFLNDDLTSDPELRERFSREARAAARLRHANIITVFDVGETGSRPFIAMEYVPGESLAEMVARRASLSLPQKLALADDLCNGLAHAHDAGVVHRDVKPANLMIDRDGTLRIVDFGIAHLSESTMTEDKVLGTVNYMSPEQLTGRPVDQRTDVFAVGAVLYELLTGHKAFPGGMREGVLDRILTGTPEPLQPICAAIDAGLSRIVGRALQKDPAARYQNLHEMRRDIGRLREQVGTATEPADTEVPTGATTARSEADAGNRSSMRSRRVQTPIAIALSVVVAGIALFLAARAFRVPSPPGAPAVTVQADAAHPGVSWALIPSGTFDMGCVPGDQQCDEDEKPRHRATVAAPFELMTTEVTVGMFRSFASATSLAQTAEWERPGFAQDDRHPVVNINWDEAQAFCAWLGARLPTEAEWERAARGGGANNIYPWGNETPACVSRDPHGAQFGRCTPGTAPVASYGANRYGLYDMAGNAWEWLADAAAPYSTTTRSQPNVVAAEDRRVVRGGSWDAPARELRVSLRGYGTPANRDTGVGVRCARDLTR